MWDIPQSVKQPVWSPQNVNGIYKYFFKEGDSFTETKETKQQTTMHEVSLDPSLRGSIFKRNLGNTCRGRANRAKFSNC